MVFLAYLCLQLLHNLQDRYNTHNNNYSTGVFFRSLPQCGKSRRIPGDGRRGAKQFRGMERAVSRYALIPDVFPEGT